jgi:hypothetical protein
MQSWSAILAAFLSTPRAGSGREGKGKDRIMCVDWFAVIPFKSLCDIFRKEQHLVLCGQNFNAYRKGG